MTDFTTLDYLKSGNQKQKKAHDVLMKHQVFEKLKNYSPVLAGTVPIEIDTDTSDLDIICQFEDEDGFTGFLHQHFQDYNGFSLRKITVSGEKSVVSNFTVEGFTIEIFAQDKLPAEQNAYLHMMAEYMILQEKGEEFKQKIKELKKRGIKTEPAFDILLGLENPYEYLLKF